MLIDKIYCDAQSYENDLDNFSSNNDTDAWILCETKFPQFKKVLNESIASHDKCRATCKFNDHKTNPVVANEPEGKTCPSDNGNQGVSLDD